MPYYSELGIYTSPSSSYPGVYAPGPYSNHSSILASNFTRAPPLVLKTIPRNFRGYKPHLATITENQGPLRRINSPKLLFHTSVPRPIKINTADIDVSVNKYRKYERTKPVMEEKVERKSPSPVEQTEQKDAKPNRQIRRDRATIRIQTIHQDMLQTGNTTVKSWRDNFDPEELYVEEEKKPIRKTPGQLLKEKFLIRSRENIFQPERKMSRRSSKKGGSVKKTPSFHDICQAITVDKIDEELNPGQPIEIQRRQSRQISSEEILNDYNSKKNSLDMTEDINKINEEDYDSRGSVRRKKKLTKKKSNEKVTLNQDPEIFNKSTIQRRPTQRFRRNSSDCNVASEIPDAASEKAYQEAIRDISQVEIEKIKTKPKPIITSTVDIEEKPSLIAVIDQVHIEESPNKPKKTNKFKFNVTVEEVNEPKPKKILRKPKIEKQKGVFNAAKPKEVLVSNILRKNQNGHMGHVLEDIKETPKEEKDATPQKREEKIPNKLQEEKPELNTTKTLDIRDQKATSKPSEEAKKVANKTQETVINIPRISPQDGTEKTDDKPKVKEITQNIASETKLMEPDKVPVQMKKTEEKPKGKDVTKKAAETKPIETKNKIVEDIKTKPKTSIEKLPKTEEKTGPVESKKQEVPPKTILTKVKKEVVESKSEPDIPKFKKITSQKQNESKLKKSSSQHETKTKSEMLATPNSKIELSVTKPLSKDANSEIETTNTETQPENSTETPKYQPTKRSLVNKANKDDPDLEVFVPPEPEPEPEPEPKETDVFVPLQSNRLSQFMHPFKKPEQFEECPIEIFARPKTIRKRHYPRPRHPVVPPPPVEKSETSDEEEEESEEETSDESTEETSSDEEYDVNIVYSNNKVGASTSSNDSGFDSGVTGSRNKG